MVERIPKISGLVTYKYRSIYVCRVLGPTKWVPGSCKWVLGLGSRVPSNKARENEVRHLTWNRDPGPRSHLQGPTYLDPFARTHLLEPICKDKPGPISLDPYVRTHVCTGPIYPDPYSWTHMPGPICLDPYWEKIP